MKQWMRRFFAVLMMICLMAGCTAWAEKTVDVNELLNSVMKNAAALDSITPNALNSYNQNERTEDDLGTEGGVFGVYDNYQLVTMAVSMLDTLIAVSTPELQQYAARGTELMVRDFTTGSTYAAQAFDVGSSLVMFVLDGTPDVEELIVIPGVIDNGETVSMLGYKKGNRSGTQLAMTAVEMTRPAKGELYGTYTGDELAQGSPLFIYAGDDYSCVTFGLADSNHRYLDFAAIYEGALEEQTDTPTAAPTSAPTAAPTDAPTAVPTEAATDAPSAVPVAASTDAPTAVPTEVPTDAPTAVPTEVPPNAPTAVPTEVPTDAPTAAPTAAPTESPSSESQTQTLLYVIIGVLAAAVVVLLITRGRKNGGKNQQQEAATQRYQPENPPEAPDEPTKQLTVDEPKARVALDCIGGMMKGMTFPLTARVVFGRDPKRCSIIYPKDAKGISGVHCAAEPTADGQIILTDLGSTYGTMVGGQKLTPGKGAKLNPGDTFALGGSENRFTVRRL